MVDSTGLKVFGEGEWKMRKHGKSKRRTWRKLHLAVNPDTHEIEAETLTENGCDDASQVDDLLDQATNKVGGFYGDGAYDKQAVRSTQYSATCVAKPQAALIRHSSFSIHPSRFPPLPDFQ